MIQQLLFRLVMSPFALLYGLGVSGRNLMYKMGILKEVQFSLPVISVGNLSVGGTGKTPHIEYLIHWLGKYIDVAVLSRGYKRKSKGFMRVLPQSTVDDTGDEPLQYSRKFSDAAIYVSESRILGIPKIIRQRPNTQVILLDDAFQHRAVKPGLNILLTEYRSLYTRDYLLPMGRLREWRSSYTRADIIIVTKCPGTISMSERTEIEKEINPSPGQKLFFSTYRYFRPYHLYRPQLRITLDKNIHALVICAIASTQFLLEYLEDHVASVNVMEYEDHHDFTSFEISQLKKQFDNIDSDQKIVLTTEKDAMRLEKHLPFLKEENIPVYVLPIFVTFISGEPEFQEMVKDYLLKFKI